MMFDVWVFFIGTYTETNCHKKSTTNCFAMSKQKLYQIKPNKSGRICSRMMQQGIDTSMHSQFNSV